MLEMDLMGDRREWTDEQCVLPIPLGAGTLSGTILGVREE